MEEKPDTSWVRAHLRICGRVQGVYYRASSQSEARRLGLAGWVRNRRDESVEAVVEGPHDAVETFIDWCHRGPPAARVDRVEVTWGEATGMKGSFEQRPTL